MARKQLWIINHRSGGGQGAELASRVGPDAISFSDFLQGPAQWVDGCPELVLVAGGDGTVGTVAHAFCSQSHAQLAIIPLGTGNDMARELNIPLTIGKQSPQAIIAYFRERTTPTPCSVWSLIDRQSRHVITTFINYLSFGFDAQVVLRYAQTRKSHASPHLLGIWQNRLAFARAAIRSLGDYLPPLTLYQSDTEASEAPTIRGRSLLFANIKSVMGLGLSNTISTMGDDYIEVINTQTLLGFLPILLAACNPIVARSQGILQGREWHIALPPGNYVIQSDGEGLTAPLTGQLSIVKTGTARLLTSSV